MASAANTGQGAGEPQGEGGLDFALGASRKTSAPEAEEQLAALWQEAGREAEERGAAGVLRVRELNFIIRAATGEVAAQVGRIAALVAGCHPARVIVLLEDAQAREQGDDLEAWITAACYRGREGGRQVCWEQVNVVAGGAEAAQIEGAVASLLVPDVPTVTWWAGDMDVRPPLFRRLAAMSQKVILDSSSTFSVRDAWGDFREALRSKGRTWSVTDLSWLRLRPWRELLAEPFDESERLPFLEDVGEVLIEYEGGRNASGREERTVSGVAGSLLLAGWLGSRLGWTPEGRTWSAEGPDLVAGFRPAAGGPTVGLRLRAVHESPCSFGGVVHVELRPSGRAGSKSESLVVSRREGDCVCAAWYWAGGREEPVRTLQMPVPGQDELLCEALEPVGPGGFYEEAMALATGLAVLPGGEGLIG